MGKSRQKTIIKIFPVCLLLLLTIVLLINLILLWSRFCYQTGIDHMKRKDHDLALTSFQQARNSIPDMLARSLAGQDIFRIHIQFGNIFFEQALELWKNKGSPDAILNLYEQARKNFEKAREIDPNTYIPAYRLARIHTALEVIHTALFPDKANLYNAELLYQEAIRLRPNGISVHSSYARYLHYKKDFLGLKEIVRNMARIYPAGYHNLKREPYFSPALIPELMPEVVREIKRLRRKRKGMPKRTYKKVAEELNRQDFKTLSGKKWTGQAVQDVLR